MANKLSFQGAFPQCRQTIVDELIPMDRAVLSFLLEQGGSFVTSAIPSRMFAGEIPKGLPDLVDMGLIEHSGDVTSLTTKGRKLAAHPEASVSP